LAVPLCVRVVIEISGNQFKAVDSKHCNDSERTLKRAVLEADEAIGR
jgi:hypothetical protein